MLNSAFGWETGLCKKYSSVLLKLKCICSNLPASLPPNNKKGQKTKKNRQKTKNCLTLHPIPHSHPPQHFVVWNLLLWKLSKLACFFAFVVANMVDGIQMIDHISYSILGLLRASMPFLLVIISLSSIKGFCFGFFYLMQLHNDTRYYSI